MFHVNYFHVIMSDNEISQEPIDIPIFKKRKRCNLQSLSKLSKKSKNSGFAEDEEIDTEAGLNTAFSKMDSQLLSDYVAQRTRKHDKDLSTVELEDKYIKASYIADTTSWGKKRNLDNLPSFLENFSGNLNELWTAPSETGAPHTIIVASAGIRAANIARSVRKFPEKEAKVAKLFAKHIPIQDAIKFLKTYRTGIAIGTPQRIKDLTDNGALKIDCLKRIVVDASHIDQKKRGILEMKETQIALISWLTQKDLRERYCDKNGGIKLLFY